MQDKGFIFMRLTILGSAAAEAVPALWCECSVCTIAHQRGGKDLRRRCCYSLDHDTMIDFGPDAFWQATEFGINLPALERLIFTHPHNDHLNPTELCWRRRGYSKVSKPLTVIAPATVFLAIMAYASAHNTACDLGELNIHRVDAHSGRELTDGDLTILPIAANHAPGRSPLIYVLSRGGKSILIANDTGWLSDSSWDLLRGCQLDAAIIECTYSIKFPDHQQGHLGAQATVNFRDRLAEIGCLKKDAVAVANHFSHNGNTLHDELEAFFTPHGFLVGYDGMVVEV